MAVTLLLGGAVTGLTGCSETGDPREVSEVLRSPEPEGSPASESSEPPEADRLRIVFLGTSLTEGLGLSAPGDEAWPARIAARFDEAGRDVDVVNAGVGGETSAGALGRLEWVLRQEPDVLVVETGANDALRALPVDQLESNLDTIVRRSREARPEIRLVLVGMQAPPNMGPDYAPAFRAVYERVAARHDVPIVPFLLEGVAGVPALNQADGMHPTAEGHEVMARTAWPVLDSVASASREGRSRAP